tara:strand:+ start:268 stop:1233 length:966 start_codon:yes stop_codon:yes gene_type:complete
MKNIFIKRFKFLVKEFLNKYNYNLTFKNKKISLKKEKYNSKPEIIYKSYIPEIELNYNYNSSIINYKKNFLSSAFKLYFPFILNYQSTINRKNNKNYFLDLGCGYGPMAVAFLNYIKSANREDMDFKYLGIDINETSIKWLKTKYFDKKEYEFLCHKADINRDYMQSKTDQIETLCDSDGSEVEYKIPMNFKHDIQWSMSYFTHLTPTSCDKVLNLIEKNGDANSLQFNSWLIIDDESKFALEAKMANRIVPYDMGVYLTRSKENPLTVTCYKEKFIKEIYQKNNLKIIKIIKGSWRGLDTTSKNNNFVQDIIVSQKVNIK